MKVRVKFVLEAKAFERAVGVGLEIGLSRGL